MIKFARLINYDNQTYTLQKIKNLVTERISNIFNLFVMI